MSLKNKRPDIISTDKASSHPLQPGRFYSCTVESVDSVGRVTVLIHEINVSFGPVLPIGTTTRNKLSFGDSAVCTFTDEFFKEIIVFGTEKLKKDTFAGKEKFNLLIDQLQNQINSLRSALQLGNINLQSFKQTD
jgi:hypothetical protein